METIILSHSPEILDFRRCFTLFKIPFDQSFVIVPESRRVNFCETIIYQRDTMVESCFFNGKKEGRVIFRYVDGEQFLEALYKNGRTNGFSRTWYLSGQLMNEGNYQNGKKIGVWHHYHQNGEINKNPD